MQEAGVNEDNAEPAEARWYLSRDGQQHGPLSDRELSLFAEGGNFQPGDLLWTEGLDEWMPADAVFGLAEDDTTGALASEPVVEDALANGVDDVALDGDVASAHGPKGTAAEFEADIDADASAPHTARIEDDPLLDDPIDDNVGALAKALRGEAEPAKLSFQAQLVADLKVFGGFCAYLWTLFAVLTVHAVVGGAEFGVGFSFFVLTTVNAFLLMRAFPLLDSLRLFRSLEHKPLVYAIVSKTLVFVFGLIIAYSVEMGALGVIGIGSGFLSLGGGLGGMVAWGLILALALLPYFTFREVEAAVGADMMRKLLFRRH